MVGEATPWVKKENFSMTLAFQTIMKQHQARLSELSAHEKDIAAVKSVISLVQALRRALIQFTTGREDGVTPGNLQFIFQEQIEQSLAGAPEWGSALATIRALPAEKFTPQNVVKACAVQLEVTERRDWTEVLKTDLRVNNGEPTAVEKLPEVFLRETELLLAAGDFDKDVGEAGARLAETVLANMQLPGLIAYVLTRYGRLTVTSQLQLQEVQDSEMTVRAVIQLAKEYIATSSEPRKPYCEIEWQKYQSGFSDVFRLLSNYSRYPTFTEIWAGHETAKALMNMNNHYRIEALKLFQQQKIPGFKIHLPDVKSGDVAATVSYTRPTKGLPRMNFFTAVARTVFINTPSDTPDAQPRTVNNNN
jgi:hypothetical protein